MNEWLIFSSILCNGIILIVLSTHHLSFVKISSSLSSKFENLRIIERGYSVEREGDVYVLCTCYKVKENS